MSNRRRARKQLSPEGRRHPSAYTANELHRFLVEDGCKLHATHLPWFVAAIERIAGLERIEVDDAYRRVLAEVSALTGHGLPVRTGPIL